MSGDQIGLWAGLIFTLMIFSYLLGDNFLYRIAVYVFVGLSAGYITIVTIESVLLPWLSGTLLTPEPQVGGIILGVIPFLLGLLLLLKGSPRLGPFGNIAIAFVIAVGTAVALVGAISGTIIPLAAATSSSVGLNPLNGFLTVIGVVTTLIYFEYRARRKPNGEVVRPVVTRALESIGQVFIIITLGAVYAGAILTSLTIFSERISFILGRITGG